MDSLLESRTTNLEIYINFDLTFGLHLHSNLELILMLEGTSTAIVDSQAVALEPGDVLAVFPYQIHEYRHSGHNRSITMILDSDYVPNAAQQLKQYRPSFPLLRGCAEQQTLADTFHRILEEKERPHPRELVMNGLTSALLGLLLDSLPMQKTYDDGHNSDFQKMLMFCNSHFHEEIDLDQVARTVHLSRYYASRLFRQKAGVGLGDFINMIRVARACDLLRTTNQTITQISLAVGFPNVRAMNRAFEKHRGVPPRVMRKAERK